MKTDRIENQVAELIRAATTPPTAERKAQTLRAMSAARAEARRFPLRKLALAAGVLGALTGLGFVPIPLGRTTGTLEKAAAAFAGATGLYMKAHRLDSSRDTVEKTWQAPGGLYRIERWEGGKLVHVSVLGKDFQSGYAVTGGVAEVDDMPPADPRDTYLGAETQDILHETEWLQKHLHADVKEWRERSLWGGEADVFEVTYPDSGQYPPRWYQKTRYEVDAATGRLLSERIWRLEKGVPELVYYTEEVAWDVDMPGDTFEYSLQKGTKVTYRHWWKGRVEDTLARAGTQDWIVSVHHIDRKPNGDLVLTISRDLKPDPDDYRYKLNYGMPVVVEAVDDEGVMYSQYNGFGCARDYWTTTLVRKGENDSANLAGTVTLTLYPYRKEPFSGQSVTLPPLQLPPPTDTTEATTEVVQY